MAKHRFDFKYEGINAFNNLFLQWFLIKQYGNIFKG